MANIEKIREIAKAFLYCDIRLTSISMVVHHPYTDSPFFIEKRNGEMTARNICEDEEALREWQSQILKKIDEFDTPYQFYFFIKKSFRLAFLKYTYHFLTDKELAEALRAIWTSVEYPNNDPNFTQAQMIRLFKRAKINNLCTESEITAIEEMSEPITIFRGIQKGASVKRMSWTTSLQIAKWFAKRFNNNGEIYSARVPKNAILAYFDSGEKEVIVDPKTLQDMKAVKSHI